MCDHAGHDALSYRYARACEARAEFIASEVLRIAMGGEQATVKTADGSLLVVLDSNGASQINRLRIDTARADHLPSSR